MSYKISTQQVNFKDIGQEEYLSIGVLQPEWNTLREAVAAEVTTAADNIKNEYIEQYQADVDHLTDTIDQLQTQTSNSEIEIDTLQTDIEALQENIAEKSNTLQGIDTQLNNINNTIKQIPYLSSIINTYEKQFYWLNNSGSQIYKNNFLSIDDATQLYNFGEINGSDVPQWLSNRGRPASVKLTFTSNTQQTISCKQIRGSINIDDNNTRTATFYLCKDLVLDAIEVPTEVEGETTTIYQASAIALCTSVGAVGNGFDTFYIVNEQNEERITDVTVTAENPSANGVYNDTESNQYYDITAIWTDNEQQANYYSQFCHIPVKKGDTIFIRSNEAHNVRINFLKDLNFLKNNNPTADAFSNNSVIWNFSSINTAKISSVSFAVQLEGSTTATMCFTINSDEIHYLACQTYAQNYRPWINEDLKLFKGNFDVTYIINGVNISQENSEKTSQAEKFFNQYLKILQPLWEIHSTYYYADNQQSSPKLQSSPQIQQNHFFSSLIMTEGFKYTIYNKASIPNLKIKIYQVQKDDASAIARYTSSTIINNNTEFSNEGMIFGEDGVNQYYLLELYLEDSTAASPFNSSEDINQAIMIIPSSDQGLVLNNELLQTFITETRNDYSTLSTGISNCITQTRYQLKQDTLYPLPQSVSDWPYASSTKKNKVYSQEFSTGDYYCRVILNLNKYQYQIHPTNNGDIININAPLYQTSIPTILPPSYTFKVAIEAKVEAGETPPDLHEEEIFKNVLQNFYIIRLQKTPIQWCALGDSITEGYTSRKEQSTTNGNLAKRYTWNWAEKFASQKQWFLDNQGVGGTGWIDSTSGDAQQGIPKENALTIVQSLLKDEYFKNIDIVTLAWGINDYKGSGGRNLTNATPLGDINNMATIVSDWYNNDDVSNIKTIVDSMYAIISAILLQNPSIQLYVLLPINCAIGSQYSDADGGDGTFTMQDNYCMNKLNNEGYSLYQLRNTMIQMCEFLGVEYIDTTLQGPINRFNLNTYLLDGVHPSEDGHKLLARYYDSKIHFSKDII